MKICMLAGLIMLVVTFQMKGQTSSIELPRSSYGLPIVNDPEIYKKLVRANPQNQLIDLREWIPEAQFNVTYADTNNDFHRPLYESADVFLRKPAAMALKNASSLLKQKGLGLIIFDGYRPYAVTVLFWERTHDTTYVADPRTGSKHNRGMAVDVSLYDLKTLEPLSMPSPYDLNSPTSFHTYMGADSASISHREILRRTMEEAGFLKYTCEWWHYDFPGASGCYNYDLLPSRIKKANYELERQKSNPD